MAKMIQYEDFSLKIEPKHGEVYPVIVLSSPAGEGRSTFQLPFDLDELGSVLFELGRTVRGNRQAPLRNVSPAATRTTPQRIGDQLFDALFSGPVRSLLDRSMGMIHGRQRGLRIKLHIDPEDPSLAQLASLPWEFLYRKETRDFLNLSQFTPILRYLDVQRPYTPLPLEPPLRILVVLSSPTDCARLDLERERALIEASWAKLEAVEVEFMERANILALQERLAERPYHVLHYMGHGDFDKRTGQGVLVLEDEERLGAPVDGSTLGILLHDVPTMRLVFLNACETARVTREKGLDPFAGVAAAMVMAGIPAVVAMQFPISDNAAITFSGRFYPLLAHGYPVDAAVAEGRRAIRLAEAETMEWGTPVLFMRAPQGLIFQVSEAERMKLPSSDILDLPPKITEALRHRLEQLYTDGLSAFWLEDWEKACRSFQAIVEIRPDYQAAATKLAEAKRQVKLTALYHQAQAAQEAEDWPGALAALEAVVAEAANFKDAAVRLEAVKKQKHLADLYAEARQLFQVQQWQAVLNVFAQIQTIAPDYPDPEGLLPIAQQEVAVLKHGAELNDLYSRALKEMDARRWAQAHEHLAQVQALEPGFRETVRLLAKAEAELAREAAERQRQEQIATWYEQALGLARAGQWRQVLAKMEEIKSLEPRFADPEGIATMAQAAVAKADEETQRQNELAALYTEAVRLLQTGQYQQALEKWAEVRTRDPRYPDRQRVQATASQKLDALAKVTPAQRGLPGWGVALMGCLALITIAAVVAIVLMRRGELDRIVEAPPAPAPMSDVTFTPTLPPSPTPLPTQKATPLPAPSPVSTNNIASDQLKQPPIAAPSSTPTPQSLPTATPSPTSLPGVVVVPVDKLAHNVPWLPLDRSASPGTFYFGFNVGKPPFHNRVVRQAFAAAVDRQAIADLASRLSSKNARPITTFTPPETIGRDLYGQMGISFNPERAKLLLADAGYPNGLGFPEVVLVTNKSGGATSGANVEIADAVVAMWQEYLNVKVKVEVVDIGIGDYLSLLTRDAPAIYRLGWTADFNDPDNFLREVFHSNSKIYTGYFSNAEFDRLVEQAATLSDPAARQLLYIQAERILCEDQVVIIPLYSTTYQAQ
jgi:hypothetical protein